MTIEATGNGRCAIRRTTTPDTRQAAKASAPLTSPEVASMIKNLIERALSITF